ncbi:fibronectin type III domain-containing protein [Campylobacter sp. TTU-622]|uniref:fibronectin type III domain-containing protein n=1 Tax=Campylobacter sp. TTU-622 TaxID=2800583 RepID=UPI001905788B|nr:fibronectin type III domain-containing protein [Campylobacter sp. TTU-622]MBK1972867.1 fibronectin type III domain-containing protein [Campylobacter sp. TTU-622]
MKKFQLKLYFLCLILLFDIIKAKEVLINESLPKIENLKSISEMSSIGFEWDPLYDQNIAGFYLYRASDSEPNFKIVATIKDKFQTHFVDTKLDPNTKYFYSLRSFNDQGHISEEGKVIEVYTMPRLEKIPFAEAITNLPNRIKLIWRPHPDLRVNFYIIERMKEGEGEFKKIAEVKNRLNAEYIDDNLKPNENFTYRIFALSFDGVKSEPSDILNSNSKALPPEVTSLSASFDQVNKILLNWDKSDYKDFSYYKIYSTSSSFLPYTLLAKTQDNNYEDIVNGKNKSKYYKVTIVDKDGLESPMPKNAIEGKTLGDPLAPSIILAQIKDGAIEVEWIDNDNRAVEYMVKRYGGGSTAIFKGLKEKKLRDIKALPGVEYTYEVISIDNQGLESEPSKKVKAAQ